MLVTQGDELDDDEKCPGHLCVGGVGEFPHRGIPVCMGVWDQECSWWGPDLAKKGPCPIDKAQFFEFY